MARSGRLQSIDVLRGFAVLAVLAHHLPFSWSLASTPDAGATRPALPGWITQWTHYGAYGVHLFLVISGFCIHLRWARSGRLDSGIDFGPFWRRRLHRLYPPYAVALGATLLGAFLFHGVLFGGASRGVARAFGYDESTLFFADLALSVVLLQNLTGAAARLGNGPFWTLALEEQLYMLYFPFLALRRRLSLGAAMTLVLVITLAFRAAVPWLGHQLPLHWILLGPARWFEWTLGALAVEAHFGHASLPAWTRSRVTLAIAAAFALACDPPHSWRGSWNGVPLVADLAFGLLSFLVVHRMVQREPDLDGRSSAPSRALERVGLVSYSIYLTHQPTLPFAKRIALALGFGVVGVLFARVACALAVGFLFFRWVESRFLSASREPRSAPSEIG